MRIWDIAPRRLCRQHLLGEHRELHAIWTVITEEKPGYSRHPETQRWKGKLAALYLRHKLLVEEMTRRGYRHRSDLTSRLARGSPHQDTRLMSVAAQLRHLRSKGCGCG